jgi:tripartite-type tricarboxylate transporter receptor subunit TctC
MRTLFFQKKFVACFLVTFSFNFLFFSSAWSIDYPTKPINLIVSVNPGGMSDLHARILAEGASKELGVPIVIYNKTGAGGGVAASFVANEKPDGYTFLVTQSGTLTTNFAVFPNLPYKKTDFIPVFKSITVPVSIMVKSDSPWKTFHDLVDAIKKNPGKFRSVTASATLTLLWESLLKEHGLDVRHMMTKGAAETLLAVMGGHAEIMVDGVTPMVSHIEGGKIRNLVSFGTKRDKNYPEVPTLSELGYGRISRDFFNGFYAPAGLPQPIMDKFVGAFEKVLSQPNVQAQMVKIGVFADFMGPIEFGKLIDIEYDFYMKLAKEKK